MTTEERFWKFILKEDSCWLWMGTTNGDGYGRFKIAGRLVGAHRFSYYLHKGPVGDRQVLHTCDRPNCVNPEHLFLGTHSDNMKDMYDKRRHGNGKPCLCHPERPYHAKGLCEPCYMKQWRARQTGNVNTNLEVP